MPSPLQPIILARLSHTHVVVLCRPFQVSSLFRRLVQSRLITPPLLEAAIKQRARPLAQRFTALLNFAQVSVLAAGGGATPLSVLTHRAYPNPGVSIHTAVCS